MDFHQVTFTTFLRTPQWPNCLHLCKITLLYLISKGTSEEPAETGCRVCLRNLKVVSTRPSWQQKRKVIAREYLRGTTQQLFTKTDSEHCVSCKNRLKDMKKSGQRDLRSNKQGVRHNKTEQLKRFTKLSRQRRSFLTGLS